MSVWSQKPKFAPGPSFRKGCPNFAGWLSFLVSDRNVRSACLMIRTCLVLVAVALVSAGHAQEPSRTAMPPVKTWPEAPFEGACVWSPLHNEAIGGLVKLVHDKHADNPDVCKLLDKLSAAQARMIVFVQASWPQCVGVLDALSAQHTTTERIRSAECHSFPDEPHYFSIREYKPNRSKLIGDWPPFTR